MNEKEYYRPLPPLLQKRLEFLAEEIKREQIAAARTDLAVMIVMLVAFFATIALVLIV